MVLSAVELVNALIFAKPDYFLQEGVARIHTGMLCLEWLGPMCTEVRKNQGTVVCANE